MARKRSLTRLSAGEMELMRMLWERGPLTLAQAHQVFAGYGVAIAYPTMQTRLNRLVGKRCVASNNARAGRLPGGYVARTDRRPACSAKFSTSSLTVAWRH